MNLAQSINPEGKGLTPATEIEYGADTDSLESAIQGFGGPGQRRFRADNRPGAFFVSRSQRWSGVWGPPKGEPVLRCRCPEIGTPTLHVRPPARLRGRFDRWSGRLIDRYRTTFRANPDNLAVDLIGIHPASAGVYMQLLLAAWSDDNCSIEQKKYSRRVIPRCDPRIWKGTVWPDIKDYFEQIDDVWVFGYDSPSYYHADWIYHRSRIMDWRWVEIRDAVLSRRKNICSYCGDESGPFEVDHKLPRSRGGTHALSNLTIACKPCNTSKKDMTAEEFVAAIRNGTRRLA